MVPGVRHSQYGREDRTIVIMKLWDGRILKTMRPMKDLHVIWVGCCRRTLEAGQSISLVSYLECSITLEY
jgi:hypothetical protein